MRHRRLSFGIQLSGEGAFLASIQYLPLAVFATTYLYKRIKHRLSGAQCKCFQILYAFAPMCRM